MHTFKGTTNEDVKRFLRTIEQFSQMCGWSEVQKITIAQLKCVGLSGQFLDAQDDSDLEGIPWTTFKLLLIKQFDKRVLPGKAKFDFARCTQSPRELLLDYVTRLKTVGKNIITWNTDPTEKDFQKKHYERELIEQFKNGISPGIRRIVLSRIAALTGTEVTFEKITEIALQEELNESMIGPTTRSINYMQPEPATREHSETRSINRMNHSDQIKYPRPQRNPGGFNQKQRDHPENIEALTQIPGGQQVTTHGCAMNAARMNITLKIALR